MNDPSVLGHMKPETIGTSSRIEDIADLVCRCGRAYFFAGWPNRGFYARPASRDGNLIAGGKRLGNTAGLTEHEVIARLQQAKFSTDEQRSYLRGRRQVK